MNTLRSPSMARAGAAISGFALSMTAMGPAHAASLEKPPAMVRPIHDDNQNCDVETSLEHFTPASHHTPASLSALAIEKCRDPDELQRVSLEIIDHAPDGHTRILSPVTQEKTTQYEHGSFIFLQLTLKGKDYRKFEKLRRVGHRFVAYAEYWSDTPRGSGQMSLRAWQTLTPDNSAKPHWD